jgi:hypothetical protein
MNVLSRYEQALLEQVVPERERQRRTREKSRSQLPLYDYDIATMERPDPNFDHSRPPRVESHEWGRVSPAQASRRRFNDAAAGPRGRPVGKREQTFSWPRPVFVCRARLARISSSWPAL